jgi:hypothetical protein
MNFSKTIELLKAQQAPPPAPVAESTPSNLVDTNIIYSPKFGQLDFSNDPWQYASRSGSGTERGQTFAITFNFGGKNYSFIPEDRIQKGWVDSGRYTYSPAFLNEDTIKSLATNAEYIDLSKAPITGAQFADGSTIKTYGDYLSKSEVGASPKGFLVPAEQLGNYFPNTSQVDPKFGAITGLARDPDTGELGYAATGGGNIMAPIVKTSRVSYYEKPSGMLADLGRSIQSIDPIGLFALNLLVPGLGTGIGVGRAIGVGDLEGAAKALVIGEIIGQSGVAQNVAGATGSAALGTAAAGTAGGLLAGQNIGQAITTGATQGAISGTAGTIADQQAADYIQNLPTPDYLNAGPAPTSSDVIAAFPETNPNLVETTLPNLTADQVDTALNTLTGGYTLGGTTEGITTTLPDTKVTGTAPIDYALNTITGGESLTLPTSPNLEAMGGGQGITGNVTNAVVSEAGLTPTGNVSLGDVTSFINTGEPVTTNKTYTYDDGSTITVDKDGNIVSFTEATDTTYTGVVEKPSSPLTKSQVEGLIRLGLGIYGASQVSDVVRDAIASGDEEPQGGFPFTPSDISGWARPEYTKTWQGPIDLNSLFTTDNLLGGTQWAGLQGNQFANIPQVSMSDFISSIQNGKV